MKKILLSVLAVAAVAVSCQTEKLEEGTSQTGKTVKIVAELPETKTIFNPEDKTVAWEDGDELTVVVNSSSAYTFGKVAGENAFSASGVTLQDGQNTYHVLYPYNGSAASVGDDGFAYKENGDKAYFPIPSQAAAAQKGINNADHVKGVIYGYTTAADSETPSVQMHQLTALLKIDVTNNHTEPIEVRSITVSTDATGQLLSGTYYINLETGETESSGDKYTYNYTTLGVTNVTMEAGATGTFWVSAHPFSVPQGSKLTISVETDKGVSSDERTYESALEFAAGTVNTASFNFEAPEAIEKLTVAEFLAKEVGNVYYELTGTISNISSTEFGNFDLTDDTGTVYVYGLTATKATSNDKSFSSLGLREGDVLTLVGTRAEYKGTAQVGGPAYYIYKGLGSRFASVVIAVLSIVTFSFTMCSVQANTIAISAKEAFGIDPWLSAAVVAVLMVVIIFGGVQWIAKASSAIVPLMAVAYIVIVVYVVAVNYYKIPDILCLIIDDAFGIRQIVGGGVGIAILQGVKRGLLSNEAGMGSAPNAAAVATTEHPVSQGLIQALGVFIDTLVVCSCTAFVIFTSDIYSFGTESTGIALTQLALSDSVGAWAYQFIAVLIFFFG